METEVSRILKKVMNTISDSEVHVRAFYKNAIDMIERGLELDIYDAEYIHDVIRDATRRMKAWKE